MNLSLEECVVNQGNKTRLAKNRTYFLNILNNAIISIVLSQDLYLPLKYQWEYVYLLSPNTESTYTHTEETVVSHKNSALIDMRKISIF